MTLRFVDSTSGATFCRRPGAATVPFFMVVFISLATLGCGGRAGDEPARRPRPVVTQILTSQSPPGGALVTASVGSWKTEEIGFEVAGRVQFVVEENTPITGRIYDSKGQSVSAGTPIARLESERFALQVARAKSEVTSAEQTLRAAETERDLSIPAQIASAEASKTLAERDYKRSASLISQNAASQGEVDRDKAELDSATAQVEQLKAVEEAKQAEVESLKSAVQQAKQNLRDAERDLEDCTLYSSFTGQIADVSVVPGSVVSSGAPVVTLQMMDPIKVDLEVSASQSRRMNRTEIYPVHVTMPDGSIEIHEGFLHQVDALADPLMRTYTLTF
ncbi:MAG: HlyD family efflux transporter periplasmic adaptor subunit, partial [Planctomycetota bacterium]